MGQKDITEKVLEDYNDVFADIINGLLFDGVQEIKKNKRCKNQPIAAKVIAYFSHSLYIR